MGVSSEICFTVPFSSLRCQGSLKGEFSPYRSSLKSG
jgi:hypothetical protein